MKYSTRKIAIGGLTAAFYVIVTLVAASIGLSSGIVQFRISEVLCVLPMFFSSAVPGLTIGCFLANLLSGGIILDAIFGCIATLIGAVGARLLRNRRWLVPIPTVVSNMIIVPIILRHAYHVQEGFFYLMLTVGLGELVCAYVLGEIVIYIIHRRKLVIKLEDT